MTTQKIYPTLTSLLVLLFTCGPLAAQYDDIYYSPSERSISYADFAEDNESDYVPEPATKSEVVYDGTNAASDYEYASRIRRFRRPVGTFNYYDPYYVDAGYYDPYFRSGFNTTLIYNTPGVSFQRVLTPYGPRVVAFDRFGYGAGSAFGYNSFNRFGRFNAWNSPYGLGGGFNTFGGIGGFNSFGAPGLAVGGGGLYCPPSYYGGQTYAVPNSATRVGNRPVTSNPGRSTSISDRIDRNRDRYTNPRGSTYNGGVKSRTPSNSRSTTTRRSNAPTSTRTRTRTKSGNNRSSTRSRSNSPSRSRSVSPSRNNRSYSPSRSRSVTPSRSASPSRSRSVTPSRSSGSRSGSSRSRGGR